METWFEAIIPLPEIAGLQYVLNQLAAGVLEDTSLLARWRQLHAKLPDIPLNDDGEQSVLLPAKQVFGEIHNSENPELYAIFTYQQW
ncbi:hypothetical protein [Paenibacillus roseipurpureus]|uniref:Uncharacterized protein n=1 Tax=Paenibacillus roseopurpureus TaxID=2918901 RepID=A0AA96LKS8_9BACL|nr:hypothetical protein [Paenibacillus sp. MBLB1832]WNR42779.1 hypothetical protein MJB10_16825 [Paenibacillus sp. MBLB1832]